jgi:DNA invertase Pin-like site-specific DNA recombinase
MHLSFSLLDTRPLFIYQQVAERTQELSRLGMSACAIARMLKITDKTVTKALRHYESGPKGTEPSA